MDTATTEIYTLSLHDALPILFAFEAAGAFEGEEVLVVEKAGARVFAAVEATDHFVTDAVHGEDGPERSEEHTSELQSQSNLVCRLLLEKKKKKQANRSDNRT